MDQRLVVRGQCHPRKKNLLDLAAVYLPAASVEALADSPGDLHIWMDNTPPPDHTYHIWCRDGNSQPQKYWDDIELAKQQRQKYNLHAVAIHQLYRVADLPQMHLVITDDQSLRSFHTEQDLYSFLVECALRHKK